MVPRREPRGERCEYGTDLAEHIEDLMITQFFLHPQNISETITCLLGFSCSENFRDIAVIT